MACAEECGLGVEVALAVDVGSSVVPGEEAGEEGSSSPLDSRKDSGRGQEPAQPCEGRLEVGGDEVQVAPSGVSTSGSAEAGCATEDLPGVVADTS